MLDHFPPPPDEARSQYPVSPSQKNKQNESIPRHRKAASTGGGRAWTEEEVRKDVEPVLQDTDKEKESFLLRTRNNKMPYKHIAAHLQKTELACRLHYHQMTFGNNRRRRTSSASSVRTPISLIPNSDSCGTPEVRAVRMPSVSSPPSTPKMAENSPRANRTGARLFRNDDCDDSTSTHSSENASTGLLPPPTDFGKTLRLDTAFAMPSDVYRRKKHNIDFARLHSIYAANRHAFWFSIASQYSADQHVSPSQLEHAFLEHRANSLLGSSLLPTPNATPKVSPEVSYSAPVLTAVEEYGFSAINRTPVVHTALSAPSPGRCAVSALLNDPLD
jgi:hypothetical protein